MIRNQSPFAVYTRLSPNCTRPRSNKIRRSTPHCVAGNLTIEATLGLARFTTYDAVKGVSANYAIGTDGRIGLGVQEMNRAWTSSSRINDMEAITTEIANNGGAPDWRMSDEAINAWMNLTVEQCRFYGYKKVNYQPKPANVTTAQIEAWIATWAKEDEWIITLHQWFAATACPGPYFVRQLPWIVKELNRRLSGSAPERFVGEGATPVQTPEKTLDEIADEVVRGIWGNGDERVQRLTSAGYDAKIVQSKVQAILSGASPVSTVIGATPYKIKITADVLNVRRGPGTNNPVVKRLVKDANTYTIIEEASGEGAGRWGRLLSGAGWISLDFVKKV